MLTRKTKIALCFVLVIALNVLGIFLFGFIEQLKLLLSSAFGFTFLLLLRKLYLIRYKEKPNVNMRSKAGGIFSGIIFSIFIIIGISQAGDNWAAFTAKNKRHLLPPFFGDNDALTYLWGAVCGFYFLTILIGINSEEKPASGPLRK